VRGFTEPDMISEDPSQNHNKLKKGLIEDSLQFPQQSQLQDLHKEFVGRPTSVTKITALILAPRSKLRPCFRLNDSDWLRK